MGERFKSKVTKPFLHGSDVAYAERLANSDLLSGCRSEIVSHDYVVFAEGTPLPPIGTRVMLHDDDGQISAIVGTQHLGIVEDSGGLPLGAVLNELGGTMLAEVIRHSPFGNDFTVSVHLDPPV